MTKLNLKTLAVAIALTAAAGGANAAMVNSQGNSGLGGELLLYAWSDSASTSYVRDLGVLFTDFIYNGASAPTAGSLPFNPAAAVSTGAGNVNNPGYSLFYQPEALMLSALGNGTTLNSDVMWGIAALDGVGGFTAQRALTTCSTPDCLTAIQGEVNSSIPNYKTQYDGLMSLHNALGTHVSPNLNGSSQAANDGSFADVSITFGLNWGGYAPGYEAASFVGNSMEFYYVQPSSTSSVQFVNGFQYANAGGASLWTLDSNGGLSWQAAEVSAVPVPAAVWLFGSGLLGLVGIARRKNTA